MVEDLRTLLFGSVLTAASRERLEAWLIADRVADALFRASLPAGWHIGDKTGAGGHGSRAIVAVIRPPERAPVLAAVYITETEATFAARNAAIATLGAVTVLLGLSANGWVGLFFTEIVRLVPDDEAADASGGGQFFTYGGIMVMPLVFGGIVAGTESYAAAFYLLALLCLGGTAQLALTRQTPPPA